MIHKKMLIPTAVTALLIYASLFVFVQLWGTSLRDVMKTISILAKYGVLILSYLLRITLSFIGLFALYCILRNHVNRQNFGQMEV